MGSGLISSRSLREISPDPIFRPHSPGRGRLRVARVGARSVVTHAYATSPLRLLTPRNHGDAAWVYTSTFGGGLVDGDAVALDVVVDQDAAAFISTQAATKAYKGPAGTTATLRANAGPRALLVSVPDPVICLAASRYHQVQRFDIAADAGLVAVDWMASGRHASGERWAFDEYYSRTEVRIDGRLLVYDPVALRARDGALPARMGRFEILALAVIAGSMLTDDAAQILNAAATSPPQRRADQLMAVSPCGDPAAGGGCVVRIAGMSVEDVGATLRRLLHFVPRRLGDDPWRRKW